MSQKIRPNLVTIRPRRWPSGPVVAEGKCRIGHMSRRVDRIQRVSKQSRGGRTTYLPTAGRPRELLDGHVSHGRCGAGKHMRRVRSHRRHGNQRAAMPRNRMQRSAKHLVKTVDSTLMNPPPAFRMSAARAPARASDLRFSNPVRLRAEIAPRAFTAVVRFDSQPKFRQWELAWEFCGEAVASCTTRRVETTSYRSAR